MTTDRFIQVCGTDEPLDDLLVIDGHCHVGQWIGMHAIEREIEGIIEVADAVGLDKVCINYAACPEMGLEDLILKTRVMEKTILLRALSWCFMAWYEYTRTERPLQNPDTFAKIKQYLADIPWILKSVT